MRNKSNNGSFLEERDVIMKIIICHLSIFILTVHTKAELDISIGSKHRHDEKKSVGMYKTKEEVERAPRFEP